MLSGFAGLCWGCRMWWRPSSGATTWCSGKALISYSAGPERYSELLEIEGVIPAPYMARIFWVAVERWDVFRGAEWEQELQAAHGITLAKLPARTRAVLAMPAKEQRKVLRERKAVLAGRAADKL
jgi:hypothetical protein